ncbi:hypothetical protein TNCV_4440441 [Trichonephila clavipes]|nr:hypothetical protein TNCV_4440441 [Trichonephila clavipes]
MAGRNMRKLTVSEALEYMRQLSKNESENDNGEEIVFSDDKYLKIREGTYFTSVEEVQAKTENILKGLSKNFVPELLPTIAEPNAEVFEC